MSLGIMDAIRMNRIISPPTNTRNNLNPTHTDIIILDVLNAVNEHMMINIRIMDLVLFQFIIFIAMNVSVITIYVVLIAN